MEVESFRRKKMKTTKETMRVEFNYADQAPSIAEQDRILGVICEMILEKKKDPEYMARFESWRREREAKNAMPIN